MCSDVLHKYTLKMFECSEQRNTPRGHSRRHPHVLAGSPALSSRTVQTTVKAVPLHAMEALGGEEV